MASLATGQPLGQTPVPLPSGGESWLVDEKWFDPDPPFLEFFHINKDEGFTAFGPVRIHLQDKNGFLWMSARESWGLFRYDGHEYKRFDDGPSTEPNYLATKEIECVIEDETGHLWLGCPLGLTRYDPRSGHFRTFENTLDSAGNSVGQVFIDHQARLWYSTENGTFLFDRKSERFERAFFGKITDATDPSRRAEGNFKWLARAAHQSPDGLIWSIGNTPIGRGLVSVNPETGESVLWPLKTPYFTVAPENPLDYEPWLMALCADPAGENLWLAGWRGGLRRFNLKTRTWTQFAQRYNKDETGIGVDLECTLAITPRPDGQLWLTTAHGLALFDPKTMRFQAWKNRGQDPGDVPDEQFIASLLLDRSGRLWASRFGLAVHDPARAFFVRSGQKWPGTGNINGIVHDAAAGKTWFAVEGGPTTCGIVELDEASGRFTPFFYPQLYDYKALNHVAINGLAKTGQTLWLATEIFLAKIELPSGRLTVLPPLLLPAVDGQKPQSAVLAGIAAAPDGSLWLSNITPKQQAALLHFFPETGQIEVFNSKKGLTVAEGRCVFLDSRGRVWLAANHLAANGVNCFDPATGRTLSFFHAANRPNSLPHTHVHDFLEDPATGRIWMATKRGLCFFDPADGLVHRVPSLDTEYKSLAQDGAGHIWAAGTMVVRLNPRTGDLKNYGHVHGMYRVNERLYARTDGAVCFGPFYRAFPDKFPRLAAGPSVHLTNFEVFNKPLRTPQAIDHTDKIELPHHDNFFSIEWSALSLTVPTDDSFAYQLQGVDPDWTHQSNWVPRRASYTKVEPGRYFFKVKCRNRGVWGPERVLEIVVRPAWWQTLWFRLLVVATLLAALAGLWRNRLRQARLHAELKQNKAVLRQKEAEFQRRIAEVTMSALRAQMNPHFIFNSLNSINRFIQLSEPDAASNYLTKFSRLIRQVLDNSRAEAISLETELETCRLYLEIESLRFAGQFSFEIEVSDAVEPSVLDVPPMLVQPFLENAIWHGLMQKEGSDRRLWLKIALENEDTVFISIRDNGIGRAAARLLKSKSSVRQKSHGMDLTSERAALFAERSGRRLAVQIVDLTHPDGSPAGTEAQIRLET